jgi:hypothetical protein
VTPNTIERIAILDCRIERLQALIESAHRKGLAARDLEQAVSMCIDNRAALYGDEEGVVISLAASSSRRSSEAAAHDAAREA